MTRNQAVYAKSLHLVWKHQHAFPEVVLRMGAFHTVCVFLAVLGKRFGDAGFKDLLVEPGVIGSSACNRVLKEKHYHRSLRCHKLVFEALVKI